MGKRKPKLNNRNCFVFPQNHISLLTENELSCALPFSFHFSFN